MQQCWVQTFSGDLFICNGVGMGLGEEAGF